MLLTLNFLFLVAAVLAFLGVGFAAWILVEALWTLMVRMPTYVSLRDRCSIAWANALFTVKRVVLRGTSWVVAKAYASARLVKLLGQWMHKSSMNPFKFTY